MQFGEDPHPQAEELPMHFDRGQLALDAQLGYLQAMNENEAGGGTSWVAQSSSKI